VNPARNVAEVVGPSWVEKEDRERSTEDSQKWLSHGYPHPVFSEKSPQTIENKGKPGEKERKERKRVGKLLQGLNLSQMQGSFAETK
jgi:hypothetical protein